MRVSEPLILGIESTCDETGAALVRGRELLGDAVATSMDAHARFGGIIPEIASRAHLESLVPVLDAALERAGVGLEDVDAVAVSGIEELGETRQPVCLGQHQINRHVHMQLLLDVLQATVYVARMQVQVALMAAKQCLYRQRHHHAVEWTYSPPGLEQPE